MRFFILILVFGMLVLCGCDETKMSTSAYKELNKRYPGCDVNWSSAGNTYFIRYSDGRVLRVSNFNTTYEFVDELFGVFGSQNSSIKLQGLDLELESVE